MNALSFKKSKKIIVGIVFAVIAAITFGAMTRVLRPGERVSAMWFVLAAAGFFALAYRFYGAFLAAKVLALDDSRPTPAVAQNDGRNYYPTNKWVLFGHHFAAIAGAGPLIGPVLAAQFGYLPGFLWIVLGSVLAGGVHDLVILFASVRRKGKSLAQMVKDEIGRVSGTGALILTLFVMIIAIAGLGLVVINSLERNSWGVFVIAMTIPIALLIGVVMKYIWPGKVGRISLIGMALLILTVILGKYIPGSALGTLMSLDKHTLAILLAVYGFFASVLPVWLLLAPRDYISSFMKIGVISFLAIGVVFLAPMIQMPPLTRFIHEAGPIIPGKVFPFLFITIACGAISGGHSLFASGTTSKMVEKEHLILPIGYGAMLVEGLVSVMALVAACVLLPGDYFMINSHLTPEVLGTMGFPVTEVQALSAKVGVDLAHRPGGAVTLAAGMVKIFTSIPLFKEMGKYWFQFALMFEAFFILTTIDAGTRVCRYIVQEMGGYIYKPFGNLKSLGSNITASLLVVLAWGFFITTGSLTEIWPIFGVANQLLAILALSLGSVVLVKIGKAKYAWVTILPMLFMICTAFTASMTMIHGFLLKAAEKGSGAGIMLSNSIILGFLTLLTAGIVLDSVMKMVKHVHSAQRSESCV